MHKEVLTENQEKLLPKLKIFSRDFGLVGGTAIALWIGHRKSVDFDLFSTTELKTSEVRKKIKREMGIDNVIVDTPDEFTFVYKKVKFTFLYYPYKIKFSKKIDNFIKTPDLLTLAAMKAYSLGRRAKWKDYVDLYFIMKDYFAIEKIIKKSKEIFSSEFNEKIFRSQLSYFEDVDRTEKIIYLKGFEEKDETIKKKLIEASLK